MDLQKRLNSILRWTEVGIPQKPMAFVAKKRKKNGKKMTKKKTAIIPKKRQRLHFRLL